MKSSGDNLLRLISTRAVLWLSIWAVAGGIVWYGMPHPAARAQDKEKPPAEAAKEPTPKAAPAEKTLTPTEAARLADAALAENEPNKTAPAPQAAPLEPDANVWETAFRNAGPPMWAIAAVSIIAVAFAIERLLGLRRRKVMPPELVAGLHKLVNHKAGFDPRQAYKLCKRYPSAAANVIRAMLLKVGRPLSEVEHALSDASQREASRLYANVRWQTLAFNVAPMLGLLGTVQGMIFAFYKTSHLHAGASRAESLAAGIYEALVCTFAGLAVAIPAGIMWHFFEGRIQKLFRELDDLAMGLMPQLERFEGKPRVTKEHLEQSEAKSRPAAADVAEKRPAASS